jgi:MFS family permease
MDRGNSHKRNALIALLLVNVLILMDRQILTVLAEAIKNDLNLSDADIGFAYGTGISVFYAIFSIPLGRLADVWTRKNMLAICVTAWSAMIFFTGTARTFVSFALFRIGVGIGEAGAAPAGMSMIADHYPSGQRSTAMAIFGAGLPIGAGLGVMLGGYILDGWHELFLNHASAPFGLRGWQVAFMCVALPGPFLALAIFNLVEPNRGHSDGLTMPNHPHPVRETWGEMKSVVPVIGWWAMFRYEGGFRSIIINLLIAISIASSVALLVKITGSVAQWVSLGLGFWCLASWAQTLRLRDPATFAMIFKSRALLCSNLGLAGFVFLSAGVGAWIVPLLMRVHSATASEVGGTIGLLTAIFGFTGAVIGGAFSDFLERYSPRARIYVMLAALLLTAPSIVLITQADSLKEAYIYVSFFILTSYSWYGVGPSVANGLVLPRMRGVSSAFYLIVISLLGWALGPYTIGFLSDTFAASGVEHGDALRKGILWGLVSIVFSSTMLVISAINIAEEDSGQLNQSNELETASV